jgi:FlaA1/EpsC-like NDP-sugar epimerase
MIRLSGRSVDEIRIEFTGLRPGEKLYEELLADADATLSTPVPQLRLAKLEAREHSIAELLGLVAPSTTSLSDPDIRSALERAVPEYQPQDSRGR